MPVNFFKKKEIRKEKKTSVHLKLRKSCYVFHVVSQNRASKIIERETTHTTQAWYAPQQHNIVIITILT